MQAIAAPLMPTRSLGDSKDRERVGFDKLLPTKSNPSSYFLQKPPEGERPTKGQYPQGGIYGADNQELKFEKNVHDTPKDNVRLTSAYLRVKQNRLLKSAERIGLAKKERRRLWLPHHPQLTVEYPMRSGSSNQVELGGDRNNGSGDADGPILDYDSPSTFQQAAACYPSIEIKGKDNLEKAVTKFLDSYYDLFAYQTVCEHGVFNSIGQKNDLKERLKQGNEETSTSTFLPNGKLIRRKLEGVYGNPTNTIGHTSRMYLNTSNVHVAFLVHR